jgi:HK97 gp10 family phage protein
MKEFGSMAAFAAHLMTAAVAVEKAESQMLDRIGKQVKKSAKAKIGEYQDAAPPFAGWAELADSTKADRVRRGYPEDEPLLRTGEMRESIGHKVRGNEVTIGSDSDIAVYQELGTEHIPPRSFLGGAMAEELPRLKEILGEGTVAALVGKNVFQGKLPIGE